MIFRTISHFDPTSIMESGQCFRMWEKEPGTYKIVAGDRAVTLRAMGDGRFGFGVPEPVFDGFWKRYFDLDTDYGKIIGSIPPGDGFLSRAARYGQGLRILRQDPWETLITFILSQRKSIPAIRGCVENLCKGFGRRMEEGLYAFPEPEALAAAAEGDLRKCGLGYRAPYVLAASRRAAEGGLSFEEMRTADDETLLTKLMELPGVGVKVASCAMLFGFHRLAASPVDVWIQRVIDEEYGGISPFPGYGAYAGVMQQYMFFYRRGRRRPQDRERGTEKCAK